MKKFSENIVDIVNKMAPAIAAKNKHRFITTSHIFLATCAFMNMSQDSTAKASLKERYAPLAAKVSKIFKKYEIHSTKFEKTLIEVTAKDGCDPEVDPEVNRLVENLTNAANERRKTIEVEDLVFELFSNRGYLFVEVLLRSIDNKYSFDDIRDDISDELIADVITTVKELDKNPALLNVNRWVKANPQEYVGIDGSVKQILLGLSGRTINSVILVGEAGVGKTSAVYALAQSIVDKTCPEEFRNKIIYQLDPASLVAGTRFRGDFEAKITSLLDIVKQNKNIILFVDEAHTLLSAGDSADSGEHTTANILKPVLSRGEIQMILASTSEEFDKNMLPQKAFIERFHKVVIGEPSDSETAKILEAVLKKNKDHFLKEADSEIIDKVITLAKAYSIDEANPRKAINLLELAFAYSKIFKENDSSVKLDDIIEAIKIKYDIVLSETKYDDTIKALNENILGQTAALEKVATNLKVVESGFCDPEKPKMSMIFAGPTGTGKTETCKQIAQYYFGSSRNLITINCGEFGSEMDVSKLTGAAPGYVGHDSEPEMIREIREKPNSVLLFDEVEKAHKSFMKVLLKILDEGEMTDNKGRRVSFRNAIIIFTTNLGYSREDLEDTAGIGFVKVPSKTQQNAKILKAVEKHFSPEFLGRIDDIIVYDRLGDDVINTLVERYRQFFNKLAGTNIELTEEDIENIRKNANINTTGARGLKRAVRLALSRK